MNGELLNFEQWGNTIRFAVWQSWGESVGIVLVRVGEGGKVDGEWGYFRV